MRRDGYDTRSAESGEQGLSAFAEFKPDLVLTDLQMPGIDGLDLLGRVKAAAAREQRTVAVIVITAHGTVDTAVRAMREGAFDYVTKPFLNDELRAKIGRALEVAKLSADNVRLRSALGERYQLDRFVGQSSRMQEVYQLIRQIRGTRINCLICGESGTGKELVAQAIHYGSDRKGGPLISVNCGAIPESLFESELFGYKKGAFTGAQRDKVGLFEAASGGTLFLDEVGELPLSAQVKVLRALAERRVTPVGASAELAIDVRIVAATNRNLNDEVKAGRFREDLYYRLNVVQIDLPPLRDRREDIPDLVRHFIGRFAAEFRKPVSGLTPEGLSILSRWRWPGNVRELQNVMERAVALADGPLITPAALPGRIQEEDLAPSAEEKDASDLEMKAGIDLEARLMETERRYLRAALKITAGNRTHAAKQLGITFRSLRYRLIKLGMASEEDLGRE